MLPNGGGVLYSTERDTLLQECQDSFGYDRSECEDMIDGRDEGAEAGSVSTEISPGMSEAVDATSTIILFVLIISSIVASLQDNKVRPSGAVATAIGLVVGIAWIIFSIAQWVKIGKLKKEIREKYGDTLDIKKTSDENYATIQTKVIDDYIEMVQELKSMHKTRKEGAIAGAIGFGVAWFSNFELVFALFLQQPTANAAGWCMDTTAYSPNKKPYAHTLMEKIVENSHATAPSSDEPTTENVWSGVSNF